MIWVRQTGGFGSTDSWFIGFVEYSDKEKIAEHGISLKPMIGAI